MNPTTTKSRTLVAGVVFLAIAAVTVSAQSVTPNAALGRIFSQSLTEDEFTSEVLAQAPLGKLQAIIDSVSKQLGAFLRVDGQNNPYTVVFSNGDASVNIVLDSSGKVAGLNFVRITPKGGTIDTYTAKLDALPGSVSYLIERNGNVVAQKNADSPMAVGSSFKLGVLAVLLDRIASGALSWNQIVRLNGDWTSLPSGILQGWPAGSPVTIHTLATLMISISDNSAADTLIHLVGREAVAQQLGLSEPLLTTSELFKLKDPKNSALLDQWRNGSNSDRQQIIGKLDQLPLPSVDIFSGGPRAIDVEYNVSARTLSSLLAATAGTDVFSVNPGLANPNGLKTIAFKGGSEPGVLNLSTRLVGTDGTTYTVIVTWNNPHSTLDETQLYSIYEGLLGSLR